jgi:gliding motility-associated-like protein
LTVNISSADGYNGDVACVSFKVKDFDDIVSFQYPIRWDSTILTFVSVATSNLPGFTNGPQNFNLVTSGTAIASWYTNDAEGITLPNGTPIMEICFELNGVCGQSAPIYIGDYPSSPIEVINQITSDTSSGVNIGLIDHPGEIAINCFSPNGITVTVDDKDVCPGEVFTVDVRVKDFDNIKQARFSLKWNKNIIQYQGFTTPQSQSACTQFGPYIDDFPDSLSLDWTHQGSGGCNLPDDFILFRLSFLAVGSSGSNTSIAVVNPILVDKFGGTVVDVGINNYNGLISLCDLNSPTILISSINGNPGDTVCVSFTVQDFDLINRMQYTVSWESSILQYIGVQNMSLPSMGAFNFYPNQALSLGVLGVEWENQPGVTRPDGIKIFDVCFRILGDPGECTPISFTDFPYPIDVQTDESNNTNVGLNGQPGTVCVENPLSFEVSLPDIIAGPGAQVCLDVTVENFIQLTNMQYSVNWNPAILQFDHIQPTGNLANFNASSYDASAGLTANGNLVIDWSSNNQLQGTSVADGTSVFQICFNVVGNPNTCTGVDISAAPTDIIVTTAPTGNANLGLTANQGSVCVSGSISILNFLVEPVDCPSIPSGSIDITVAGGSGNYQFTWTGPGVNPTSEDQTGLNPGNYAVTVVDMQFPSFTASQQFVVELSPNAPIADAGQDTTFSCGSFFMTLNGTGSSVGPNFTYNWVVVNNDGIVLTPNILTPNVVGGTVYRLTVTDTNTGCTDVDEVKINAAVTPFPEIAAPDMYTCDNDTLALDASLSPFGFEAEWTAAAGGEIVPGTETSYIAAVTAPGEYYLRLFDSETGCFALDTVMVMADTAQPVADAGDLGNLGCNDANVPLDGSNSSVGPDFAYKWSVISNGEICGNDNLAQSLACSPGVYQLLVINTANGCTAVDQVQIMGDTLKPTAIAGPTAEINCIDTLVSLDATASSSNGNFTYAWAASSGGVIEGGETTLTPTVSAAGTYTLTVTNDDNGCSSISSVTVTANIVNPTSQGTVDHPITCEFSTATLDGNGSSTGADFTYSWQDENGMEVGTDLVLSVSVAGNYTLVVENTQNGCKAFQTVEVEDMSALPLVSAGDTAFITCNGDPTLNGVIDSSNPNLQFQWSGPVGSCLIGGNTINPTASCEGMYFLTVLDTFTTCINKDSVLVLSNENPPIIAAESNGTLTCTTTSVTLQASSNESDIDVQWESVPVGAVITDPNSLNPTVTVPTTYLLTVISNTTGCTATELLMVAADTAAPVANAGLDAMIDCVNTIGTLNASGSTTTGTTITWEALNGGTIDPGQVNNLEISVEQGEYLLTVTNLDNGCTATDIAVVQNIADVPNAVTPVVVEMGCGDEFVILDGFGSDTGTEFSYQWSTGSGSIISSELTAQVNGPGTYFFTVFNQSNQCDTTIEVLVSQVVDGEPANAMIDGDECSVEAMLLGNLPAGATGQWLSLNGATIEDANAETTLASGLQGGENAFVWTLSLGFCENYSADTASINLNQSAPEAFDDEADLLAGNGGTINVVVLENDEANGAGITFNLLTNPDLIGEAALGTAFGSIDFFKSKCYVGEVAIPYQICSESCPELCDTANLIINIEQDDAEDCDDVPNGITPNGDGKNDEFVFDILLNNPPDAFPDNEIVIFNRWGDEVFHAKPYLNDWRGTNNKGNDLPQGTYYYILRLDIENGDIIEGDVTILR